MTRHNLIARHMAQIERSSLMTACRFGMDIREDGLTLVADLPASALPGLGMVDFAERIQEAFVELAEDFRTIADLRDENRELRHALQSCVDACDRFLAPVLADECLAEDADGRRALAALEHARTLVGPSRLLQEK